MPDRRRRPALPFPHGASTRGLRIALTTMNASLSLVENLVLQFQASSGLCRIGRTVKPDGKRNWIIADATGVSSSVAPKQVRFVLGPLSDFESYSENLAALDEHCHKNAQENQDWLPEIWDYVISEHADTRTTDVNAVTDLVFSSSDPLHCYVSHLLLSQDKIYFKEKTIKGQVLYEARTSNQVRDAQLMQEALLAKEKELEKLRGVFVRAYQERSVEPLKEAVIESDVQRLAQCLKHMALELEGTRPDARQPPDMSSLFNSFDDRSKHLVKTALSALGKNISPMSAFDILVAWGMYSKHENLALLKSDLPHLEEWDPSVQDRVKELMASTPEDIDRHNRLDLTHLPSYAIDSKDTSEVDDAISWDSDTGRIYVHVADPTRYFATDLSDPILQAAFRRAVTLYLPNEKFTMFPPELATQVFSLDAVDSDGSAMSFSFCVETDGSIRPGSVAIEITRVATPIRYTYEEVDAMLSADEGDEVHKDLHNIYDSVVKRKEWREMEGGAIIINNPFSEVTLDGRNGEDAEILLSKTMTDTKSWILVSELMIAACAVAGEFARDASLDVPFRGQEPFDYPEDDVLESYPDGPVRAAVAFRNATPSQVDTKAMEHASLGLDTYLQVTSPIRRSCDLVAHFQLKAKIRGESPSFSVEQVRREIARSGDISRTMRQVENRTKKYWQLEYLRRMGTQAEYDGVYVRGLKDDDSRLGLVYFEEFGFQMVASAPSNAKPGSLVKLRVEEANPRSNFSRVEANLILTQKEIDEFSDILEDAMSDVSSEAR